MRYAKVRLDAAGRILIPAEFRKALDMRVGEYMALDLDSEQNEIRVCTMREAGRRIQEAVRPYKREGVSVVDELIAERRAEAKRSPPCPSPTAVGEAGVRARRSGNQASSEEQK